MDKLNFYRQKRRDGGVRTGIEFNNERMLELYEAGRPPLDSALLWFVDVRCSGKNLPSEPEMIRNWFLERDNIIQTALHQFSQDLIAGIDADWPMRKTIVPTRHGIRMAIYCSATRRLTGTEISDILSSLAKAWPKVIRQLPVYALPVSANG
jgi:hypothetical protein